MNILISFTIVLQLISVPGDSCHIPIVIPSLPFNDHLSTEDHTSALNLSDPCIQHTTLGPDIIYEYTSEFSDPVDVAFMAVPIGFWNLAIYVLSDCDAQVCVRGNDFFGPGSPETLTVTVMPNETYYFVIDGRGENDYGVVSFSMMGETAAEEDIAETAPWPGTWFRVGPNPSAGLLQIWFSIEQEADVTLTLYDASGRLVRHIGPFRGKPGEHTLTWDGLREDGTQATAGIYFVGLKTESRQALRKFVFVR